MSAGDFITKIKEAARALITKYRLKPTPAMIGTPPSARRPYAIPSDPAEHASQFAHRWTDRLERYVEGRMHALDIPEDQMGASDPNHQNPWRIFPDERIGGSVVLGGRIYVDSGVLNPQLLADHPEPRAAEVWAKATLRDRIDAIIAHEITESETRDHAAAEARAEHDTVNHRGSQAHLAGDGWSGRANKEVTMLHNLTIGYLDTTAIQHDRRAVVLKPLPMETIRRLLAELGAHDAEGHWRLGRGKVELLDGYLVIPWLGHGTTELSEEFALRMNRETGCVLADREHSRIVEPEQLHGLKGAAVHAARSGDRVATG